MREIEFRGKNDANEWLYGYLTYPAGNSCPIIDGNDYLGGVMEETIGQYTGLVDKNGKKIYEGDILKSRHSRYSYKVYFEDYRYFIEDYWGTQITPKQEAINHFECEVIGNIYENPELLNHQHEDKGE